MAWIVSDGEHSFKIVAEKLETRPQEDIYEIEIDDDVKTISIVRISKSHLSIILDGVSYNVEVDKFDDKYDVSVRGEQYEFSVADEREISLGGGQQESGEVKVKAPMPGMVIDIKVNVGDTVSQNDNLLVLEAMKMQNDIKAPKDGEITKIAVEAGNSVNSGELLLIIT